MMNAVRLIVRTPVALVALVGVAWMSGCSRASDPVEPALWRQVDAAENHVYAVLADPSAGTTTPEELLDRLSAAAVRWDAGDAPPAFSESVGTAVIYNEHPEGGRGDSAFDLFVTSGVDEHFSIPGWLDSRPARVYTCYRIEVSLEGESLSGHSRTHDYGDDQLVCPSELVWALGDSAQFREPWLFDG